MTKLSGYSVTFGYGATDGVYYYTPTPQYPKTANWVGYAHRGNDYPLVNEPVIVAGTVIGISGQTGAAGGPHCHVQAGRDTGAQQTIDPTDYTNKPGTVYATGTGSQWGNYVCVKVGDVYVYYCHLSKINVQQGQIVGKEMEVLDRGGVINRYRLLFNREPSEEEINIYKGKTYKEVDEALFSSKEIHDRMDKANGYDDVYSIATARGKRMEKLGEVLKASMKNGDDFDTLLKAAQVAIDGGGDTSFKPLEQTVYIKK